MVTPNTHTVSCVATGIVNYAAVLNSGRRIRRAEDPSAMTIGSVGGVGVLNCDPS